MAWIEIDDDAWNAYKGSWALLGIRAEEKLIDMLEDRLWRESINVIENAERELVDYTPEAYVRREIGLEKEKNR